LVLQAEIGTTSTDLQAAQIDIANTHDFITIAINNDLIASTVAVITTVAAIVVIKTTVVYIVAIVAAIAALTSFAAGGAGT